MVEHPVRYPAPLRDPLRLVEGPVDAQVDPALPVLLFRLREGREGPRHHRPRDPLAVERLSVELVGNEREGNVVTAIETPQDLEEGAAEPGMP